jgi:hypothetical protein
VSDSSEPHRLQGRFVAHQPPMTTVALASSAFRLWFSKTRIGSKGLAAPETGQAYARARELWEQLGSPAEFLAIPYGQSFDH